MRPFDPIIKHVDVAPCRTLTAACRVFLSLLRHGGGIAVGEDNEQHGQAHARECKTCASMLAC